MRDRDAGHDDTARVHPLSALDDMQVAKGEPDVRGWPVHASGGEAIGAVRDLLVDRAAMRVSHLDVVLQESDEAADADRVRLLVPIGAARRDARRDELHLPMTSREAAAQLGWEEGDPVQSVGADRSLFDDASTESGERVRIRTSARHRRAPRRG